MYADQGSDVPGAASGKISAAGVGSGSPWLWSRSVLGWKTKRNKMNNPSLHV